jgi:hypothetical protein
MTKHLKRDWRKSDICLNMVSALDIDVHAAWDGAHELLFSQAPDPVEIEKLVAELQKCAERVKSVGQAGENELRWLAQRLSGRLDQAHPRNFAS